MIALVVVVLDEATDFQFQFTREVVVLEFDHVLHRPVVAFDLSLGHRMIRGSPGVAETSLLEIFLQLTRDRAGTVV